MNSVILPYEMQVESIVYQNQAFALGIIKPNIRQYDQWLCNKYINCVADKVFNLLDEDVWMVQFGLCIKTGGYMNYEAFHVFCPDLVEKNKQMLEQGFYILGTYDEFYIPGKAAYQNYPFVHGYVIYGYDDQKGVFKSAGYLAGGRYKQFDITYEDYYRGVTDGKKPRLHQLDYFRINTEYEGQIDIARIREKLTDFLHSRGSANPRINEAFGVSAWKRFETYIDAAGDNGIDMRYVRAYMEHKGIMDKRLKCLLKHGYLQDQVLCQTYQKEVFQKATQLFNMCLKYILTGDAELQKRMTALVRDVNITEQGLIEKVEKLL